MVTEVEQVKVGGSDGMGANEELTVQCMEIKAVLLQGINCAYKPCGSLSVVGRGKKCGLDVRARASEICTDRPAPTGVREAPLEHKLAHSVGRGSAGVCVRCAITRPSLHVVSARVRPRAVSDWFEYGLTWQKSVYLFPGEESESDVRGIYYIQYIGKYCEGDSLTRRDPLPVIRFFRIVKCKGT